MEIVRGIHQISLPLSGGMLDHVNVYVVEGDKGNLLIDTGMDTPEAFGALRDGLKSGGFGFKDITLILVTHIHPDHYGMAANLKQLSGAELALGEVEAGLLDSRYVNTEDLLKKVRDLFKSSGVPEDDLADLAEASLQLRQFVGQTSAEVKLKGGEKITVGSSEFKVLLTPGHSPGHICLYEPKRKFLFSGDHVLPDIAPHVGLHPQSGENPLADFIKSLEAVMGLEVNFVFPGHGHTFSGLKQKVEQILYHHKQRKLAVSRAIEKDMKTAYQIATEIPWMPAGEPVNFKDLSTFDKRLAVLETLAHLQFLVIEGEAEKVAKEDVTLYWAGG